MVAELPLERTPGGSTRPCIRSPPRSRPPTSGSPPGSTRATSATALWAVIHEAGHGLYENGVAQELWRSPLASPASLGFHESQSRTVGELGGDAAVPTWSSCIRAFASSSRSSSARSTRDALPGGEQGRAVADPGRGRPGHLQPPHHPSLRARAGDLRRVDSTWRTCPRPGTHSAANTWGFRVPDDAQRRAPGRPLGGRDVRVLPHLLAGQRDRRPALGRIAAELPTSTEQIARGELAPGSGIGCGSTCTGTATSSCRRSCSSRWWGPDRRGPVSAPASRTGRGDLRRLRDPLPRVTKRSS